MSLRRDIHSAFESIAPPLGGMPERVVQTVLADKRRRRKNEMLFRLHAPLSLVAALIVIALVAAVLVGGRVIQSWNVFENGRPAGSGSHATLAALEARPLQLPQMAASAACPSGPMSPSGVYGNGPFYGDPALASGPATTSWGTYWNLVGQTDPNVSGLMLVRALDVKTQQHYVFVGEYAAGTLIGTDTLSGSTVQQHAEMVLDTRHAPNRFVGNHRAWAFKLGVPTGNSGCYGYQVDGDTFTETFVFDVNA